MSKMSEQTQKKLPSVAEMKGILKDEQAQEWNPANHHPSCSPNNRDLVWHCPQCGALESAEAINAALAAEREKIKRLTDAINKPHPSVYELRALL